MHERPHFEALDRQPRKDCWRQMLHFESEVEHGSWQIQKDTVMGPSGQCLSHEIANHVLSRTVAVASTPPAMPPAINETNGDVSLS